MKKFFYLAFVALAIMACGDGNDPNAPEINPVSDNGMLPGKFTVDDKGTQVQFSQGNLQYQASTDTWRFAYNQWEYTAKGWLGYFMWGTGDDPTLDEDHYKESHNGFTDWGINPISNGGNEPNRWRTLKDAEWNYLFYRRNNAAELFGMGNIAGRNGMILLPDNWVMPTDVPAFTPSTTKGLAISEEIGDYEDKDNNGTNHFKDNVYTADQWRVMEAAGAVFLPAAGYLWNGRIEYVDKDVHYWSQDLDEGTHGKTLYFDNSSVHGSASRTYNFNCVRLVH